MRELGAVQYSLSDARCRHDEIARRSNRRVAESDRGPIGDPKTWSFPCFLPLKPLRLIPAFGPPFALPCALLVL